MKPRPHYDSIIAWANGAQIQLESPPGKWVDCKYPIFTDDMNYRVKPGPKTVWVLLYTDEGRYVRSTVASSEEDKRRIYKNVTDLNLIILKDWTEITYEDPTP